MPQSFASLHIHVIFGTKDRRPSLLPDVAVRVYSYMGGIVGSQKGVLVAAGGIPDHVHLLIGMSRESSIAGLIREVKGGSSEWIHQTFPDMAGFGWQDGYAAFAVSCSNIPTVRRYIENQAEHHRKRTFEEELIEYLEAHKIEYDPRYLLR
jgi:REP element-mobilizing transposase RayT